MRGPSFITPPQFSKIPCKQWDGNAHARVVVVVVARARAEILAKTFGVVRMSSSNVTTTSNTTLMRNT
eukprot:8152022-Pyramimonas_sp.AAC.1